MQPMQQAQNFKINLTEEKGCSMLPAVPQNTEVLLLTTPQKVLLYTKNQENIDWEVDRVSGKFSSQSVQVLVTTGHDS